MADTKAQFAALLDAAVDAIIQIDDRGHIQRFNKAAENIFGYNVNEVLGENVKILMPEPFRGEHDSYIHNYQTSNKPRIIGIGREVVGRHKSGREFPIDLSVGEARHADTVSYVGIIRDISQRKQAEIQLSQQREELQLIFANAPTGIFITDTQGIIVRVNSAVCRILGYSEGELLQLSYKDITHPDDLPGSIQRMEQLARGEIQSYRFEKRYLCKNGEVIHGVLHNGVIHDADGQPMLFVAEIEDLSDRIKAEHEAQELRERLAHVARVGALGEMASGIAHELNQPLSAIASYARASRNMITSGSQSLDDSINTLDKITHQAERAGEVIHRLRTFLRRSDSMHKQHDCNNLIREVVALLEMDLRDTNINLQLELSDEPPLVDVDGIQIQQVLLNLVRNGIEAMREVATGETITIRSRVIHEQIEITVSDQGPGIDRQYTEQLFEPFYTTKPQGMGMGLSLCRTILRSHGGELSAVNNRLGGASFTIRLPSSRTA